MPGGIVLSTSPRIRVYDQLLSTEECAHLISLGAHYGMKQAMLVGKTNGVDISTNERTNKSCWIPHNATPITEAVVNRISALVGMEPEQAEQIQLIWYTESQYYMPHYDGWAMPDDPAMMTEEDRVIKSRYMDALGGQRLITALGYLNTIPIGGGGETEFPHLTMPTTALAQDSHIPPPPEQTLKVYPTIGKVICFSNVYDNTNKLHPNSLHAGCPVRPLVDRQTGLPLKNEKWAFNLWFREKRIRR